MFDHEKNIHHKKNMLLAKQNPMKAIKIIILYVSSESLDFSIKVAISDELNLS